MTSTDGSGFLPVNRTVASVQKAASVTLCLLALVSSAYTALNEVWPLAGLFLIGLALAVQSYGVVEEGSGPEECD